jgi:hypothetical protein
MKDEAMKLAVKTDAVFAASIEFIGALTGMKPPPIEIAPPEVLKPFNDFTEKVCAIFATTPPAQEFVCSTGLCHYRKPLTDEQIHKLDPLPHRMYDQQRIDFARAIEAAHGITKGKP